jgi:nucleoside-diphosphate-sugar epimerase
LNAAQIEPFLIDLQEERSAQLLSGFLNSNGLIIAIPPRVKHNNNFKEQILRLIPFIESSPIQNVIFISSTSVYPNTNSVITEEHQGIPESNSGKVLLEVEELLKGNVSFQTTVLRLAGLYGHDRKPGRFLAGKKELANGQGKVNLIHQTDCIEIISLIIEKQVWGEVFNCCSDKHPTRSEFYTKAALTLGMEAPEFLSEEKSSFKIISNEKLKRTLNYEFIHPDPMELV